MQKNKLDNLLNYSPSLSFLDSIEEKLEQLEIGEVFLDALLVGKIAPGQLTEAESKAIETMKNNLSEQQKNLISEIYMAKYMDISFMPPEYTLEEIQELYEAGLYFTLKEIMEIIDWENGKSEEEFNADVVNFLFDCIDQKLYINSPEDADDRLLGCFK